jgi:hypothetical protein
MFSVKGCPFIKLPVPQQTNSTDCGLFMLYSIEQLIKDPKAVRTSPMRAFAVAHACCRRKGLRQCHHHALLSALLLLAVHPGHYAHTQPAKHRPTASREVVGSRARTCVTHTQRAHAQTARIHGGCAGAAGAPMVFAV